MINGVIDLVNCNDICSKVMFAGDLRYHCFIVNARAGYTTGNFTSLLFYKSVNYFQTSLENHLYVSVNDSANRFFATNNTGINYKDVVYIGYEKS